MKLNNIILMAVFFCNTVFATQIRDVVGNDELLFEIAALELTRIAVENDYIASLQFANNVLEVKMDKKLGQAYVMPKSTDPINLFVTTQKGFVYKLLLNPSSIPATQIILKNKRTLISPDITNGIANDYERKLTELVLGIQTNETPLQCVFYEMNKGVKSPVDGVKLKAVGKYICKEYIGYKFEIRKKDAVALNEADFVTPITKAVKIYDSHLIIINKEYE
jgi:hypothetical protein